MEFATIQTERGAPVLVDIRERNEQAQAVEEFRRECFALADHFNYVVNVTEQSDELRPAVARFYRYHGNQRSLSFTRWLTWVAN